MNPVDEAWTVATHRASVVTAVEARLTRAGALLELRKMQGLSAQEMDVLIHQEIHEPVIHRGVSTSPQIRGGVAA